MRPLQIWTVPRAVSAVVAAVGFGVGLCSEAFAAAPPPCGGVAQISDPSGDGHHENTDVLSAWFSEQSGHLQAVIKVTTGDWRPMHVDSDAAGWAMLFDVGGQTRFVRVEALKTGGVQYDYGTWTLAGGFVSAATTTGEVVNGPGGTATIDVPAETGAVPGTLLAKPFVLTYERAPATPIPHWVDRGPGGTTPEEAVFGADFLAGSCLPAPPAGGGPAGDGTQGASAGAPAPTTTAVVLGPLARLVGAGRIRARGRVVPPRGGVTVQVTAKARGSAKPPVVRYVRTLADGSFSVRMPLSESSTISAVGEGINAQTQVVTVHSTIRMTLRRLPNGKTVVSGLVSPRLPGRVLLLRTNAATPSATTRAGHGHFRFTARRFLRGRYEAVFIPYGDRAERSTSASGVIR
ncbi:MAG: hypothetical protein QOJ85_4708 [Solirubrobacteraceae bacterium]|nr:hypothetical protein [Solirubrobacteraceae bacterium]MEA2243773.1 hypothetical protein [Solirubrobacteraceae bacterium]